MASLKVDTYIQLLNITRGTSSSSYAFTSDRNPIWYYDADDYDQVSGIYFEAVMRANAGSPSDTAYMNLQTVSGSSDVTGSEVSTTSTTNVIVRSGDISANLSDNTEYRTEWKSAGTGSGASLDSARIIVSQNGAVTKTAQPIELGDDNNVPSTSYSAPSDYGIFRYTASEFDGTVAFYLEADLHNNSSGDTTYAALYDITAGAQVASSEVSHTGDTTTTRKRSSAITLVDGHEYRPDVKGSSTSDDVTAVKLVVKQTGTPTKTTKYNNVLNNTSSGTSTSYTYQNRLIDFDNTSYDGDSVSYDYEATIKVSANSGDYNLYNDTDASQIASVNTSSTSPARVRSTGITMPSDTNNVLNSGRKINTSGTITAYRSYLIAIITWSTGTTYTPTLTDSLSLAETLVRSSQRTLSEAITLADSIVRSITRMLSDTSTMTDVTNKSPSRTLSDSATTSDSLLRSVVKLSSDTVTMVDTLLRSVERILTDSSTLTDTIISTRERLLTDAVSLADSLVRSITHVVSDSISLAETVVRSILRVLSDTSTLTEVFVGQISGYFKELLDSVTLTDTITNILDKFYGVGSWIKAWFGPNKPTSVVGDDKPNSVVNDNNPVQMSSGDDTPTGSILSSDRPTKV